MSDKKPAPPPDRPYGELTPEQKAQVLKNVKQAQDEDRAMKTPLTNRIQ